MFRMFLLDARMLTAVCALAVTAPVSAKDPPSTTALIQWTACLRAAGVEPSAGLSPGVLESALKKCVAQEEALRRAIAKDPIHYREYNVDNMKTVLRAQQHQK